VLRAVRAGEEEQSTRRIRRRRIEDIEALNAQVRALVTNAAYALALGLEPPTVGILLARPPRKRTRYDEPPLRQINAALSIIAPHLVTVTRSRRKGIASVLMPGDALRDCVGGITDFNHTYFRQIGGGETIILHRRKRPRSDGDDASLGDDALKDTRELDYRDTRETNHMRAEIRRINAHLRTAPLTVIVPEGEVLRQPLNHEQARRPWITAPPVNFTRCTVRKTSWRVLADHAPRGPLQMLKDRWGKDRQR
jgi:hypothetical protein